MFIVVFGLWLLQAPAYATTQTGEPWQVVVNARSSYEAYKNDKGQFFIEAQKLLEDCGWVVFWKKDTNQLAANSRDGDLLVHTLGSAKTTLNGVVKNYSLSSVTINGKSFLPLKMLETLLNADSIIEDAWRQRLYVFKTFTNSERNKQAKKILQVAESNNYNPMNFLTYLQYQKNNPSLSAKKVVLYVNIGVHIPPYSNIVPVENPHSAYAIVDKNHKFEEGFIPDLTWIDGFQWAKEAGDAWVSMKKAAKADGVTLALSNTYRSIATQRANYNSKIRSGRSVAAVDMTNARPGHSEHHTGYAADMKGLNSFVGSRAHSWLVKNGHKYGFIISFQAGKEFIHGYEPEGWHIRWFPVKDAMIMYEENLTIQEYDNLYLNPRKHGYQIKSASVKANTDTDYVAKWRLAATPTKSTVFVNGEQIVFATYTIGGDEYFRLRDLAYVLNGAEKQFDASWDNGAIVFSSGKPYTVVGGEMAANSGGTKNPIPCTSPVFVDGRKTSILAFGIGGSNYFRIEDIGREIGFEVSYDTAGKSFTVFTGGPIPEPVMEDVMDVDAELMSSPTEKSPVQSLTIN